MRGGLGMQKKLRGGEVPLPLHPVPLLHPFPLPQHHTQELIRSRDEGWGWWLRAKSG